MVYSSLISYISQYQYSICPESFWGGPGTMAVPTNKTCYWGWMIDLQHAVVWINNNLCSRIMPTTAIAPVSQSVYCGDHLVIYAPWIFAAELWRLSPSGSDAGTAPTKLWAILAAWKWAQPSLLKILCLKYSVWNTLLEIFCLEILIHLYMLKLLNNRGMN